MKPALNALCILTITGSLAWPATASAHNRRYENSTPEIECKIIDGRLELFAKEGWQGAASIAVSDRDGNKTAIPVQFIDL